MKSTKYAIALLLLLGMAAGASAQSSTYYFKHFATSGTVSTWYDNDNSWGYHNTTGSGFVEMVMGEDWGTFSAYHPIPAVISTVPAGAVSQFTEQHVVNSGGRIDATWDNFVDVEPSSSRQGSEIMVWMNYTNTQPIADKYDGSGKAVPHFTNVAIAGRKWNIYEYQWSSGYWTITFVDQTPTSTEKLAMMDFTQWCVTNKFFPNTWYMMEVGAGWEFSNGWASATAYSNTGW